MTADTSPEPTLADLMAEVRKVRKLLETKPGPEPLLMACKAAARYLGISRSTFLRAVAGGKLPKPVQSPGGPRWRVSELRAWADRLKVRQRKKRTATASDCRG